MSLRDGFMYFTKRLAPCLLVALTGCQSATLKQQTPVSAVNSTPETAISSPLSQTTEISQSAPLNRTFWRVKTLIGRDVSGLIDASVAFVDQRISGRAGCNYFFADYSTQNDQLDVERITTSRKICFSTVMHQEQLLLKMLAEAKRFERGADGSLIIYSRSASQPLVLRPISRTEMPVLAARH